MRKPDYKKMKEMLSVYEAENMDLADLPDILLFGRESAGVPNDVHDIADHRLTIPMKNEVRSINLSSSVALVIGEGLRQINGI